MSSKNNASVVHRNFFISPSRRRKIIYDIAKSFFKTQKREAVSKTTKTLQMIDASLYIQQFWKSFYSNKIKKEGMASQKIHQYLKKCVRKRRHHEKMLRLQQEQLMIHASSIIIAAERRRQSQRKIRRLLLKERQNKEIVRNRVASLIQRRWKYFNERVQNHRQLLMIKNKIEQKSAKIIQQIYFRLSARKREIDHYSKLNASSRLIQKIVRGVTCRKIIAFQNDCALYIQKWFLHVKKCHQTKSNVAKNSFDEVSTVNTSNSVLTDVVNGNDNTHSPIFQSVPSVMHKSDSSIEYACDSLECKFIDKKVNLPDENEKVHGNGNKLNEDLCIEINFARSVNFQYFSTYILQFFLTEIAYSITFLSYSHASMIQNLFRRYKLRQITIASQIIIKIVRFFLYTKRRKKIDFRNHKVATTIQSLIRMYLARKKVNFIFVNPIKFCSLVHFLSMLNVKLALIHYLCSVEFYTQS